MRSMAIEGGPECVLRVCLVLVPFGLLFAAPASAQMPLSGSERSSAFRAAGFRLEGGRWRGCGDPGTPTYQAGTLESVGDLNGDGRPEALIAEGSTYCFGSTEAGYVLVSKQADGSWRRIAGGPGVPTFLATKGAGGWPDIEVGGPGICFPVERWNGRQYVLHRHQYEGRPCRPQR